MLSLWEAIQSRRSIRRYASDDVPDKLIGQILEAARLAPSGGNSQPWRFIVVRDEKDRKEICRLRSGQRFVEEAPVTIVCFADLNRYSQEAKKNKWNELVESGIASELSGTMATRECWEKRALSPAMPRDQMILTAISNSFIAIEHLLLMAAALGLGACWLGASEDARLNQLFNLPDNLISVAVITVGYPAGQIPGQR
ncbi:MAG: nitroreductase family protein, partial [Gammaproteobacteria bacterium]|nr:nitroreductase family protein [Gammaproteobacteria bacterium]